MTIENFIKIPFGAGVLEFNCISGKISCLAIAFKVIVQRRFINK